MSNEAFLGLIVTIVLGVGALLITTKKNSIKISQKNKNGNANMNNNTIGNDINTDKRK